MHKLLMIAGALVFLGGSPAEAGAVIGAIKIVSSWFAGLGAFGQAVAQIGASILLNAAVNALAGRRGARQQDLIRDLQQPTSLPVYRFVYGECWAPGTPAPVRVKGDTLYACYLLNSRPSAGPFTLFLDKREVEATGDPYDFLGDGAISTNAPFTSGTLEANHCRYWIGRGDQVSPPQVFLDEAPEHYQPSDGWRGRTVIWLRLRAGDNKSRQERWPSTPPEVMVAGRWSLLEDPRTPSAPAAWSDNQALCTLDALRNNPLRPYDDRNLWLETFSWAADVADSPFPVKGGGTIPRYRVNGVLAFTEGSELEDQVMPLADAGASRFLRVGGRLGLVPGVWSDPVMEIDDVLSDQPMSFSRYRPSGELVTEVRATYTSPERMYEDATTPIYTLAGAQAEDGGAAKLGQFDLRLVTDHRQAQYVAAIMGRRTRMQRAMSAMLPPRAFDLVAGSNVTVTLPAPYINRSGLYEVEQIQPGFDATGREGVALRCPTAMRETSASVYAWTPATDEQDISMGTFQPPVGGVRDPGAISTVSDASTVLTSGDTSIARVLFAFPPSPSQLVISYEWHFRQGSGLWQTGGMIDRDILTGGGQVFGYLAPAVVGQSYTIRVRAVAPGGASEWVESAPVTASAGSYLAPAPAPVSAIGGSGEIAVTFRAPNSGAYRSMEIWGASVDDSGAAVLLFGPIFGAGNSTVTEVEDGLGSAVTRFYFARSIDRNGEPSPFSASISATTT